MFDLGFHKLYSLCPAGPHQVCVGQPGAPRERSVASHAPPSSVDGADRPVTPSETRPSSDEDAARRIDSWRKDIAAMDGATLERLLMNGKIPDEILENKGVMSMIQRKVDAYSTMMNMLTQMQRSSHELNQAIVRNIRA